MAGFARNIARSVIRAAVSSHPADHTGQRVTSHDRAVGIVLPETPEEYAETADSSLRVTVLTSSPSSYFAIVRILAPRCRNSITHSRLKIRLGLPMGRFFPDLL